ncbi:thioether cross-link-forming SCIFF peptide maturase [Peptostreptococcaceae bacterium AGR-M142]
MGGFKMIHKFNMDGINIVMDINSGAIHIIDNEAYDVLDFYKELDKEQIINKLSDKYDEEDIKKAYEEIEELEGEGLLYGDDQYINHEQFKNREQVIKALCLNVAHDCNLKCSYCFASQGDFGGERKLMDLETGKRAFDFLIKKSGNRRNLEVDFFGGEPLMNFEVVKELVKYGREQEKIHNKNFRFTITTNGILLNDEITDFINEHMHNIVLSLDGRKDVNDSMRPTMNDKGSYDIIVPKYQKLIEKRGDKEYFVRGTFTRKNLDFSKDVMHFYDLGMTKTSVEPVVDDESNPFALREEDLPKIFEEYEILAKEYAKKKINKEKFTFFHFMIDLNQGPCIIKRITACGAGTEYISVTPEGDIYPCHQFVGKEDYKLANLYDDEILLKQDLVDGFRNAHVYAKEDCKNCWAKFYCSGGCHANALNFNGDVLKPYKLGCEMQKKRIECAIMVKAKELLEG